jgi:23S rRNA (cytidine1920-2'-O)/16S rRNA (cytidine1409-2'-O)-methyltransferase
VRRRLDAEMVRRGLASSRTEAALAIRAGRVTVAGRPVAKAGTLVGPDEPIAVAAPARHYVSRGGEKLEAALDRFGVSVAGRRALDAGASTGGFTDCLLARGAAHVVAVDVGYGQLHWRLREDPRVTVLERTHVRDLDPSRLPYSPEVVSADLSFISLRLAVPALARCAAPGADFLLLVKPQFEAGREEVGKGGVVADPEVWGRAIRSVAAACSEQGVVPRGVMASPLPGPAGNVEFFLWARKAGADLAVERARLEGEAAALERGWVEGRPDRVRGGLSEGEVEAALEEGRRLRARPRGPRRGVDRPPEPVWSDHG